MRSRTSERRGAEILRYRPPEDESPRLPPVLIERERLTATIEASTRQGTTLVCAGAGWGKTVAVRAWAATTSRSVGWLTLTAADSDPDTFRSRLFAVLGRAGGVGPASAPPADCAVAAHECAATLDDFVLVLDGVDEICEPRVLEDIRALLRYPSNQLAVVLLARVEPRLSLHRERVSGELTDLRDSDLRFFDDECAQLLARHGVELTVGDARRVQRRTGGWPAGLSLAAAFLGGGSGADRRVEGFTGALPAVAAYLTHEVLSGLPASVRSFLRRTSLPDEVCAGLADALTEGSDSARLLENLEQTNALVTACGEKAGWYRYHPLLRDLLRYELSREEPGAGAEIHRRAARWYDDENDTLAAIRSAVAGAHWPFLARLLETGGGPLALAGDHTALVAALNRVPASAYLTDARLELCTVLLRYCAGDYEAVPKYTGRIRRRLAGRFEVERRSIEVTLRTLELAAATAQGNFTTRTAAATDILDRLAAVPTAQFPALLQYRSLALGSKGVGLFWTGRQDKAERYLEAARAAARIAGVQRVELDAQGHLALLAYLRGFPEEAREHAVACHELAVQTAADGSRTGQSHSPDCVAAYVALVLVESDRQNVPAARQALLAAQAARAGSDALSSVLVDVAHCVYSRLIDDVPTARTALRRIRSETLLLRTASTVARWVALVEAEIDLVDGHPERVEAQLAGRDPLTRREAICLARAEIALGDFRGAESLLARLGTTPADLAGVVDSCIREVLLGLARRRTDRMLGLPAPEAVGFGSERWLPDRPSPLIADLLTDSSSGGSIGGTAGVVVPPVDRLSEREDDVLRYLPTMLSAQEIADELHVSVNTVKAHLKSIYRKLGASRRREAVMRARGLGILGAPD
ncbi:helix-turn-helix transcriptional regulator [Cryptosporangium minutisporangium]|uniref:LuxR C-terminal-related transcriptional regulator n=1 Tax=Cryptosporangium minutisporangium TaxID=113569 RepID=A0ABP6SY35_9ACTN